jgi:hypothetical protein
MPKIGQPTSRQRELKAVLAIQEEFLETGWHRSARDNWTREWDGYRITVFRRRGAWFFVYQPPDDGRSRFSSHGYECRQDAQHAAGERVAWWWNISE